MNELWAAEHPEREPEHVARDDWDARAYDALLDLITTPTAGEETPPEGETKPKAPRVRALRPGIVIISDGKATTDDGLPVTTSEVLQLAEAGADLFEMVLDEHRNITAVYTAKRFANGEIQDLHELRLAEAKRAVIDYFRGRRTASEIQHLMLIARDLICDHPSCRRPGAVLHRPPHRLLGRRRAHQPPQSDAALRRAPPPRPRRRLARRTQRHRPDRLVHPHRRHLPRQQLTMPWQPPASSSTDYEATLPRRYLKTEYRHPKQQPVPGTPATDRGANPAAQTTPARRPL